MRKIVSLLSVLMLLCILAFGQTRKVTGVVRDEKGDPIPFATITETGTRNAAQADANGIFIINVGENARLTITATGHNPQTITPGNGSANVTLTSSNAQLNEVVVTALGIQRQAKELGYSTSKVNAKDLVQARPLEVQNGLTGKVAGLQINTVNNGVFAPTRIVLRGNRSLTGNNQPLVVVDGSIFYGDLGSLNPDDIQDITILKGASASAIYGSDASNGVINVTTKKGVRGKPVLNFSTTTQLERVSYMPDLQTRFGSNGGEKYISNWNDYSTNIPYENQSYGPEFHAGVMVPVGRKLADGSVQVLPFQYLPNEKRNFFNTGITEQNNLSFSSGDENGRFFISGQDASTQGVMPKDVGRRDVFRVAGERRYGIFTATYSLDYTYKVTNTTNTTTVYENVMNTPGYIPLTKYKDWQNNKFATIDGYYNDYFDNPYWDIDNYRYKTVNNTVAGNVNLNLKPTKWLTLNYRLAINALSESWNNYNGGRQYSNFSQNNSTVYYSNPSGTGMDSTIESPKYIATTGNQNPSYNTYTFSNFLLNSDFLATIDKNITKDFNLKLTVGTSYVDNRLQFLNVNAGSLTLPVYNIGNRTGLPALAQYNDTARKFGAFGDLTVGFKSLAFLHGSYRGDIDSRLSKKNRFIPYYDIDASIILSEIIPNMKDSRILNFLKLRGAHSVTGNASALGGSAYIGYGAYQINPVFNPAPGGPFSGVPVYLLGSTVANPNLKPETITENEVGLEFGFWRNRGTLTVAGYQSELTDGIVTAPTPFSSGFQAALVNAAHTKNIGLEMELKVDVIKARDLNWQVGVNWTHNQSKVISINGNQQSLALSGNNGNAFAVVGYSYPVVETHDWVRDPAGHVIVDAVTGDAKEDPNFKILGQVTPKDIVGFTTTLSYKRFTFAATADYRGGYVIFNSIGEYSDFTGISAVTASTGRQRFVFPNSVYVDGSGKYVTNTNITTDDANFNFWPGTYDNIGANYVVSAAAWKLREVAITYDIPRTVFAATKIISRASITLSGRNLIMLRPKTNQWTDPEFSEDTGNDVGRTSAGQLPPTRIFSATLAITF